MNFFKANGRSCIQLSFMYSSVTKVLVIRLLHKPDKVNMFQRIVQKKGIYG